MRSTISNQQSAIKVSIRRIGVVSQLIAVFALALTAWAASAQVPQDTSFSGRLVDAFGVPLVGPMTLDLKVFDAESGGSVQYIERHSDISIAAGGEFSVLLGGGTPQLGVFNAGLFDEIDRYIEAELISPVSETLTPRVPIASVPWALLAQEAISIVRDPNTPLATRYLSIPSSAFTSQNTSTDFASSWSGNGTGTSRSFGFGGALFAPVTLPHGATVTQFRCGGVDGGTDFRLEFKLFRNFPQQANVELAVMTTTFPETGFRFLNSSSITSPVINNASYNYYVIAKAVPLDVGACPACAVGFCRVSYTTDSLL